MNQKIYSVGEVNNYIKNILANDYLLKNICIKGEISNCKYHSMGHIYFSLKDETGSMSSVMFKTDVKRGLKERLKDGMEVVVKGRIDVFPRDGKYQLYAREIINSGGTGQLFVMYEKLKEKLYNEGLFDFEYKKPIPKYPKTVGVVTAKTGAAIQDIINIQKRRNPYVQLILYPAKVQGEGAAATIIKGIETLDAMGVDTIIIGRGGGTIEDLWAFNDEALARAIFAAKTPIISGTGHEVDNTIADYVSDLRAPTPSAACELAIPDVMKAIRSVEQEMASLTYSIKTRVNAYNMMYERLKASIDKKNPYMKVMQSQEYLAKLYTSMENAILKKYEDRRHRLELGLARLNGLSPTAKLINGFGYISKNGEPVLSKKDVARDDELTIYLHDGNIDVTVK